MTLQQLNDNSSHLLLKCISGSQAYGLSLPHSDIDLKGVFVLPKSEYFGLIYTDQVNNATNDEMYYELKKFIDLLLKNNPNIIELLNTPEDCILHKNPVMDLVRSEHFLSRLCNQTFGQYAYAQIKKAKGLNKKISNPMEKERKTILDFCFVIQDQGSVSARKWLIDKGLRQEECGLVRVDHMRDIYTVFHSSQAKGALFNGIFSGENANDVSLTSIPKGLPPLAVMNFNKDGYSIYCRDYKEYWDWVESRNKERYENTISHGKNYDAKNMMHVFRLLNMAEEIATHKQVNVRRPEREYLLKIRSGEFLYEDLVNQAEEKIKKIDDLFATSDLPDFPDSAKAESTLIEIRERCYVA